MKFLCELTVVLTFENVCQSRKRPREATASIPAPALSFNQHTGGAELFRCTLCGLEVANRSDGSTLVSDVAGGNFKRLCRIMFPI